MSPFTRYFAFSESDTVNLVEPTDAIYVGDVSGGAVVVAVLEDNSTCTFSGVPIGTVLHIRAKRVNATSTTAAGFVALDRR